jgi:hypothetical protein
MAGQALAWLRAPLGVGHQAAGPTAFEEPLAGPAKGPRPCLAIHFVVPAPGFGATPVNLSFVSSINSARSPTPATHRRLHADRSRSRRASGIGRQLHIKLASRKPGPAGCQRALQRLVLAPTSSPCASTQSERGSDFSGPSLASPLPLS